MNPIDLEAHVSRSAALEVSDLRWDDIPKVPIPAAALRTLRYMQDIETHTIVYLRELLSTRALDDPAVATFLACWFYEETLHGRILARFLEAVGQPVTARPRSVVSLGERAHALGIALVSKLWDNFVAVHMTWGAIAELTTLAGYQRLALLADHPVLSDLLGRIVRDESRHFAFYFKQAQQRLQSPRIARVAREIVDRFWTPVGSGVQPAAETRFVAHYLFAGPAGALAASKVDETIRRLPGFADVPLLTRWLDRHAAGGQAPPLRATASALSPT